MKFIPFIIVAALAACGGPRQEQYEVDGVIYAAHGSKYLMCKVESRSCIDSDKETYERAKARAIAEFDEKRSKL